MLHPDQAEGLTPRTPPATDMDEDIEDPHYFKSEHYKRRLSA
jgi:hypothetical protein